MPMAKSVSMISDDILKALPGSAPSLVRGTIAGTRVNRPVRSQVAAVPFVVRRMSAPIVRVIDQIALSLALFLTLFSSSLANGDNLEHFLQLRISVRNVVVEIALLLIWRSLFWMVGLYQPRLNRSFSTFCWKIPLAVLLCSLPVLPILHLTHVPISLGHSLLVFWTASCSLMVAARVAIYTYEERVRPAFRKPRTILICGTGAGARMLALELPNHPDYRYHLAGFIDSAPQPDCSHIGMVLGGVQDLESILMHLPIDEVMIALPMKTRFSDIEEIAAICGRAGIQFQYSLDLFNTEIAKHRAADGNRVVVEMVHQDHRLILKSTFDRALATLGLIALAPLFLLIAGLIKLTSKGPVFFVQQRFGLGKRKFGMIKFRTMVIDAEAKQASLEHLNEVKGPIFKIKQDPRITSIGAFLRRTSLDELPQLFNVLKGDMSLVGPRPLPTRDVERFSEAWLMRRFSVKPGITGLWQVSGRSDSDFDNVIKLDLRYIDRWSLLLDIKILFLTFAAVIKGRGAY